ncbi:COL21A1, partial [Symbiodinium microadriaticum]
VTQMMRVTQVVEDTVDPVGRGHSPDYRDSSNVVEDERVVVAPHVAVRDGKLVLGNYDDDLPSDQEDTYVRSQGIGEEKIRDPEVYAQLVLKQGLEVDESVVEYLFELFPDQRISRKIDDGEHAGLPPKAWASGVYRHGGVLGVRNSTKDYPLATKVVNLFIQEKLGEQACWSTFSMHRNLNVKKHRWWSVGEEIEEEDVVILDGERGLVKSFQSEEGNKQVIPFDPRRWHATRQWSGNRLVLAVYNVRGLEKINSFDKEIVERLGFQLSRDSSTVEAPKIRKLLGNEGGESQQPQRMEVELEPMEAFMHIRMTEVEWNTTSSRYGANHYIAGMAARWEHINPSDDDLNSVIPAAIVEDLERDWVQNPRMVFVDDEGEELHVGSMMAMTTARVPSFEPGGMSSDWIKA